MYELYLWTTPNGRKPLILLEELGVPYENKPVRLNGEQKSEAFLAINPNGRIPALIDRGEDPAVVVWESGAILTYLAEKHGQFLPEARKARAEVFTWLFFQMGGIGPMFGQAGHFMMREEKIPYAIDRYRDEAIRLYKVLDQRLSTEPYLGGADYSIADMATYPWVCEPKYLGYGFDEIPHVKRWVDELGARPAVQKAMALKL